jgi:hypothetical protein
MQHLKGEQCPNFEKTPHLLHSTETTGVEESDASGTANNEAPQVLK